MRLNRHGVAGSALYLLLGLGWVLATDPGPTLPIACWFVIVAAAGTLVPGVANQVSLARAYLAAPALAYSLVPGRLGFLAVVLAIAGVTDLVDGTIARRFDHPSALGGGLDPVVDGIFLGAVALGLAAGGAFPLWLGLVVVGRYLLPALAGAALIASHRRPELRHTLTGQVSTALIIILLGGICLFRGLNQDSGTLVGAAQIVIPVASIATFVHLAVVSGRRAGPTPA